MRAGVREKQYVDMYFSVFSLTPPPRLSTNTRLKEPSKCTSTLRIYAKKHLAIFSRPERIRMTGALSGGPRL